MNVVAIISSALKKPRQFFPPFNHTSSSTLLDDKLWRVATLADLLRYSSEVADLGRKRTRERHFICMSVSSVSRLFPHSCIITVVCVLILCCLSDVFSFAKTNYAKSLRTKQNDFLLINILLMKI